MMQNFDFQWATRMHFGKDVLSKLPEEILGFGNRALFVYGEHSAVRSGAYDIIHSMCEKSGITLIDFTGIEPNPRNTTIDRAVEIIKKEKPDCIIGMGGGSIIDSCKAMSIGAYYDGPIWDFYEGRAQAEKALPILTIPTMAASGAEVSNVSVIMNLEKQKKSHYRTNLIRPSASFSDPRYTFSVPEFGTACGVIDAMSHIYEGYFSTSAGSVQDGISEGVQRALIENGKIVVKDPCNYEARAQVLWASQITITHLADNGRVFIGAVHALESALSGYMDLTHGAGIGICTRAWLKYALNSDTAVRIARWGRNVWNLSGENDEYIAGKAIECYENFLKELGLPLTLKEWKGSVPEDLPARAADSLLAVNDTTKWFRPMYDKEDVIKVLEIACGRE